MSLAEVLAHHGMPAGLQTTAGRATYEHTFCILDNSRSMLKRDAKKLITTDAAHQQRRYETVTRWEEVTSALTTLIAVSHAASLPTELRLLNKGAPVTVGDGDGGSGDGGVEAATALLRTEPSGLTPMCKQIAGVVERVRAMAPALTSRGKRALLVIVTDGESTDGSPADVLKALQGLPLTVVVRLCTDEADIAEYWHAVSAALDVDVRVLRPIAAEARAVAAVNPWLTYGEPLHFARTFGLVAAADALSDRPLTPSEVAALAAALLLPPTTPPSPSSSSPSSSSSSSYAYSSSLMSPTPSPPRGQQARPGDARLPDPDDDWGLFVRRVGEAQQDRAADALVHCPATLTDRPWFNVRVLAAHVQDPARALLQQNEDLLWKLYAFYATNAAAFKEARAQAQERERGLGRTPATPARHRVRPVPVFHAAASRAEKRLLHQDDALQVGTLGDDTSRVESVRTQRPSQPPGLATLTSSYHHRISILPARSCWATSGSCRRKSTRSASTNSWPRRWTSAAAPRPPARPPLPPRLRPPPPAAAAATSVRARSTQSSSCRSGSSPACWARSPTARSPGTGPRRA